MQFPKEQTIMVPDDELLIQQMLGISIIPDDIQEEYGIRITLYHRHGPGGPLGPLALIDMLRFLDYSCEVGKEIRKDEERMEIDWHTVPTGTPVQVRQKGLWIMSMATYQGIVQAGILAIERFGRVDEYRAIDVRLPTEDDTPTPPPPIEEVEEDDEPAPKMTKTPRKSPSKGGRSTKKKTGRSAKKRASPKGKSKPDPVAEEPEKEPETPKPASSFAAGEEIGGHNVDSRDMFLEESRKTKWTTVKKNTPIYFREGDETHEGVFLRSAGSKRADIQLDDELKKREAIPFDSLMLA